MYKVFNDKLSDQVYTRATEVIDILDYMAQTSGESPELVKGVKTLAANRDIKLIIIRIDNPPTVIASNKHALIGLPTNEIFSDHDSTQSFKFIPEKDEYTSLSTIWLGNMLNNGQITKASVGVVFDVSKIRLQLQNQILNTSIALVLTMICALGIVYILTNKYIFKPLAKINWSLNKNNSQAAFSPIPISRDDEIGTVATTLNQLFTDSYQAKISYREQKERYDLALEGTKVGLLDWDIENNEMYCSSSVFEMLGITAPEDMTPDIEWLEKLTHKDDIECANSALVSHLKSNTRFDVECRLQQKNGKYVWVRARGQAVRNEFGRAVRMVGYFVDVSKRKAHEHFMNSFYILSTDATTPLDTKLNKILKETLSYLKLSCGLICNVKDNKYCVDYCHCTEGYGANCNKLAALKDVLYQSTQEKNDIVAIHNISESEYSPALIKSGINSFIAMPLYIHENIYGSVNFYGKDNRLRPFDEREKSFVRLVSQWIGNEFTRSQYIDYLHDTEIHLEDAVSELTNANAELENFVYVASHDLQEPLRMITNFTGLLKETCSNKLNSTEKEYLAITSNAAVQMQKLIKALLEYARASKEDEKMENVDLNEVLSHVSENLKKQIQESNAVLVFNDLPSITGNKASMISLLQNLISNGIKFQLKNNTPVISISAEQYADKWELTIEDNGIGIHPKYLPKIFEPFKRLHANNEYSGTGIGLAVCKKIIDRMDGSLHVKSNEGVGTTFYITIPKQIIETGKAA